MFRKNRLSRLAICWQIEAFLDGSRNLANGFIKIASNWSIFNDTNWRNVNINWLVRWRYSD